MFSSGTGDQLYWRAGIPSEGEFVPPKFSVTEGSLPRAGVRYSNRPLAVRCGAFGDMVLLTALIRTLHARFHSPVDIVTSGPWSEPLLRGQPGVGEIWSVRSRKAPYWLSADQRRVVQHLRARGPGPTWYCDGSDAARPLLARAGIPEEFIVDVRDHPLLPGEHATEQWRRLAQIMPAATAAPASAELPATRPLAAESRGAELAAVTPGCHLDVSDRQRIDLDAWLRVRGLAAAPLILIQIGNKRTMRRGLRRMAVNNKYWPNERWAEVLRHVRLQYPEHAIVLLGTGPEYALNQEVAALANVARLYNAADDLPIPRLVALLARAAGLITVDSGPAHAAAAVGCPLVVLFGKALPSLYRPWGTAGADVKVLCGQIAGEPDMLGIESRSVIEAWSGLKLRDRDA
jgi:ADP-heptose:LPS heptosyltransferase